MAVDTLTCRVKASIDLTVGKNIAGASPLGNTLNFAKLLQYTVGTAGLQFNNAYAAVLSIAASGNQTIDLSGSLANLANDLAIALTGVKLFAVVLLGTADTAPDLTTVGTACSSITFGNATNPCLLGFGAGTSTWQVFNGDLFMVTNSTAAGWTVTNSTADGIKFVNNDAGVGAKILVIIGSI